MLRGMNSGLYFQTNKVLLFGEVLILKPKKKKGFVRNFFCGTTQKSEMILSSYCCYAGSFWW